MLNCILIDAHLGPGSSVGIATGYRLDGPGIEARWGRDFSHLSRPALGPTQPPIQWVPGLSQEVKNSRGVTLTRHSLLVLVGHERVELYLYSPYGPYSLYRATVPVQGVHFTYFVNPISKDVDCFCEQMSLKFLLSIIIIFMVLFCVPYAICATALF